MMKKENKIGIIGLVLMLIVGIAIGIIASHKETHHLTLDLSSKPDVETDLTDFKDVLYGIVNITNDTIYYDVLKWNGDIGIYLPLDEKYIHLSTFYSGGVSGGYSSYGIINNTYVESNDILNYTWINYKVDNVLTVKEPNLWIGWNYDTRGYNWINVRNPKVR
jgi:hypothetical protein